MKHFKYFFQKNNNPLILSDYESGKVIEVNEQVLLLLNRTTEEFFNLKRTDIYPQKAIKELEREFRDHKDSSSTNTFILDKDGSKLEVEVTAEIITEDNKKYLLDTICVKENKPAYSVNYGHNIEELIKENEIKYKTLFESANDSIFLLNNEIIVDLNSKTLEMFGGTKEEILGKTPYELSPEFQPDGRSSYELSIEKINNLLNGQSQFFEWQHKRFDNSIFDTEVSLNTLLIGDKTFILAIVRDITNRKRIEQDLIESRRSLFNLLKNLPGIAYRCKNDETWTMEYISEGCYTLTGYDHTQLVNNNVLSYSDLIIKEDKDKVRQLVQEALENRKKFEFTYRIKTADEKIKWVWEQGNGIYSDETGELLYLEGLINDITEQKLTEEALKHSEVKFRSLVEKSLVGVYIIQDGRFPYVNPRLAEIFGYTAEEIISSKTIEDLTFNHKDSDTVKENIKKRLSGEIKTIRYTFKGKRRDNTQVDIEVMGSSTMFNDKPAIIGTLLDITEKKKYEKEITKLSRGVEQSPASIVITGIDGNIEYVNSKFTEVTGYSFDEVVGKNPRILKYGDTPKIFYENLWDTIKSGEEWRGEFLNKKKNGELFWEFASISPIKDNEGKIINFLAVKEDITERKNIEEELRIAKDKAEEMNSLKSVFLANMSHELRTPMVAVLGYAEILKNEITNPDLKEMAKEVFDSSHRFMNTLNLILDLSRIESNKEVVNLVELDVISVVNEEFEFFKHIAKRKNLQLKTNIADELIITLLDERMIRQVISNITSNAIKFTNKGNISLDILKERDDVTGKQFVVIKISDTGIGIPKNNQSIIFDAFRQISEGLNKTFEGSGLGLTVSKKFIEMMQGTIDVESEFGKGSTFIIKFPVIRRFDIQPINLDPSQMKIEFPENNQNVQQLLLVEDDLSNAGVIKFFLESSYSVDSVPTGEEAVTKASSMKYTAVLMDIDLGTGMSGLEAAKKIKALPGYENTPIIAVTALAMRGDREKFLTEGCTHYISKPFKKEELVHTVKEAILKSTTAKEL